jgi:hypothetical protein
LKPSDKIAQCKNCYEYAKSIDPENWSELYQKAWLKIKERELRDPHWNIEYYKSYFYTTLNSIKLDEYRKSSKKIEIFLDNIEVTDTQEIDHWSFESKILHKWLQKRVDDDYIQMLQGIADLSIKFKKLKQAADIVREEMSERTFYKYLAEAKKEIDYEHFLATDRHPLSDNDMVRLS